MALGAYEKTPYEGKWPSTIIESFVVYEIIEYVTVAEWLNAPVLKIGSRKRLVGSNPTCDATGYLISHLFFIYFSFLLSFLIIDWVVGTPFNQLYVGLPKLVKGTVC